MGGLNRAGALLAAAAWVTGAALAQGATVQGRGEMLYANHCIACHDSQVHWRDRRQVTDWTSLEAQVRHWQAVGQLNWSGRDIEDVARHLNERIYRFPPRAGMAAARGPSRR